MREKQKSSMNFVMRYSTAENYVMTPGADRPPRKGRGSAVRRGPGGGAALLVLAKDLPSEEKAYDDAGQHGPCEQKKPAHGRLPEEELYLHHCQVLEYEYEGAKNYDEDYDEPEADGPALRLCRPVSHVIPPGNLLKNLSALPLFYLIIPEAGRKTSDREAAPLDKYDIDTGRNAAEMQLRAGPNAADKSGKMC